MKNETLVEILGLLINKSEFNNGNPPLKIGENYFVRTVTNYMVGKLEEIVGGFLVFSSASWIPDTGRFMDFLKIGEAKEVEPVSGLYRVAIGSIVDVFEWKHNLPDKQK